MGTLITGGTGFIGAEIARLLLESGEEGVVVFDINPSTQRLDDIADDVEAIRGDLGNFSHVLNAVQRAEPRTIYHLGGMLSIPSDADPSAAFRANALGTFHVLEAARLLGVEQVLFSSTIATYGFDIREEEVSDFTLQRPGLFYGACKVFGEHMGLFYKRKYGIDFRGLRYPSIVGPGVRTPGIAQYTSWVIEECAKGNPFAIWVRPETKIPILYHKDAAGAMVRLARTPLERIKMVNYVLTGIAPVPSAQDLVDLVRARVPDAQIVFEPDMQLQELIDKATRPIRDACAREEWGWAPKYGAEDMVQDFLAELERNPQRYA